MMKNLGKAGAFLNFPKAVLFDLDGTLVTHTEALEVALETVYPRYPELRLTYDLGTFIGAWKDSLRWHYAHLPADKLSERERRIERIKMLWAPVKSQLSEAFCLKVAAEYLQIYQGNWKLHEDVLPMLGDFGGIRLGIVTNGYVKQQNEKLQRLGIDSHFSAVVTSEEAGVGKPSAAIFRLGCQKLQVHPSDAVYVGDLLETDALGSQNAGLQGVWLNRRGEGDDRSRQVRTIKSLEALKALFL